MRGDNRDHRHVPHVLTLMAFPLHSQALIMDHPPRRLDVHLGNPRLNLNRRDTTNQHDHRSVIRHRLPHRSRHLTPYLRRKRINAERHLRMRSNRPDLVSRRRTGKHERLAIPQIRDRHSTGMAVESHIPQPHRDRSLQQSLRHRISVHQMREFSIVHGCRLSPFCRRPSTAAQTLCLIQPPLRRRRPGPSRKYHSTQKINILPNCPPERGQTKPAPAEQRNASQCFSARR